MQQQDHVYYSDILYEKAPAPILKRLAKHYGFRDLTLTSFDENSYAIGFGDEDGVIIPNLFKRMKLFNIGILEVQDDKNLDLRLFEEFVMDYLVFQSEKFENPFIKAYEGESFKSAELESYKEQDMIDNFARLDKENDFISIVENEKGQKKVICHTLGTKLIEKCINIYANLAESYVEDQKQARLGVLNSASQDVFLRETVKQELQEFTVEKGLEFLPAHLVADFKRDLQKCIVINYMSTMSILLLVNDTFKLSDGPPKMYNQISDHYSFNTLHINFKLLLPQEKSMIFNPSTFEFTLLRNISDVDLSLPLLFKDEGGGERVEKDRSVWVDFNDKNPLYFSEDYVKDPLSQIDSTDYDVIESLEPIFIYAN